MSNRITMITSGKGGTGKSTVAVHLASQLAAQGKLTLLVELDSALRSVDIISGVYGKTVYDIEDVLSGICDGSKAVVKSPLHPNLSVISAPVSGGVVRPDALECFCHRMKPHFEQIIIDTAAGLEAPFCAAAGVCDTAVLVVTPDPVCVRDARVVSDLLWDKGVTNQRMVINRLQTERLARMGIPDLDWCIDQVGVRLLGVVPESVDIALAGANGSSLPATGRDWEIFHRIALRLTGQELPLVMT